MSSKVTFFGPFGEGNLGNECTLLAILYNLRLRRPDVQADCICTSADARVDMERLTTVPIRDPFATPPWLRRSRVARHLAKILVGIPYELSRWVEALRALRGSEMLIVPGTQFLSDNLGGPFGWPYLVLKWSVVAKLRRCKLLFVSVGIGPLRHALSRFFVRCALSLANYRSYRDEPSRAYAQRIGVDASQDPVYPDLAFSLPTPATPQRSTQATAKPVVAVGVKEYQGQYSAGPPPTNGDEIYRRFRETLTTVVAWLLEHKYTVRFVIGDVSYDPAALADLRQALQQRGVDYASHQLIDEPIHSLDQLLSQLADSDIVVSPRFHNVALGLLLEKPVIALAYHGKFAALFDAPDLATYNVPIDDCDAGSIIAKLIELEGCGDELRPRISRLTARYRSALDDQYRRIFGAVSGAS